MNANPQPAGQETSAPCPYCHEDNPASHKFCWGCASSLRGNSPEAATLSSCPACGFLNPPDAAQCTRLQCATTLRSPIECLRRMDRSTRTSRNILIFFLTVFLVTLVLGIVAAILKS